MNIKHQQDISRKVKVLNHVKQFKNVAKTCHFCGICRETFINGKEYLISMGKRSLLTANHAQKIISYVYPNPSKKK